MLIVEVVSRARVGGTDDEETEGLLTAVTVAAVADNPAARAPIEAAFSSVGLLEGAALGYVEPADSEEFTD